MEAGRDMTGLLLAVAVVAFVLGGCAGTYWTIRNAHVWLGRLTDDERIAFARNVNTKIRARNR